MPVLRGVLPHIVALSTALAGVGCGDSPPPEGPDAPLASDAAVDAPFTYTWDLLGSSSFTELERTWTEYRYRVHRPDGRVTYVQWIPSDKPGARPVVVATMPYAGIAWTGEEIDTRWAGYPLTAANQHLDVDGPAFDGTSMIVYDPTPIAVAFDQSRLHRLNDSHTLLVYGRFYAGGDVRDDVADMTAGMAFVAERENIDHARVGVFGGSWGGFEALYAARHADPRLPATVVSALYPPSDFVGMYESATTATGAAHDFMIPYVQRILAATGGPPATGDFSGLRETDLCGHLPAATLLLHDEHDNLVPVDQSKQLATCGAQLVLWPRTGPVDRSAVSHGPLLDSKNPAVYTYAALYLALALAPPDQANVYGVFDPASLRAHLALVRTAQQAGRDMSALVPRLRELADPRVYLFDLSVDPPQIKVGADAVATAVNAAWNTTFTAATIRAGLAGGLPTP